MDDIKRRRMYLHLMDNASLVIIAGGSSRLANGEMIFSKENRVISGAFIAHEGYFSLPTS